MMKKIFFPSNILSNRLSLAVLFLRLVAGAAFMIHGWTKIQNPMGWMGAEAPVPGVLQALAAVAEFGGGLLWIVGFLTPIASLFITITMVVAVYFLAVLRHAPFVSMTEMSYEIATVYLGVALVIGMAGPGKYSIDAQIQGKIF